MGTSAMRETEAGFRILQKTSLTRAMRFAAIALGVGLVMATGPVRAGDDEEEDDRTFEEKIIHNLMTGIGGTNMESKGIEYRERSPLVVPPKIDLPPPAAATEAKAPNWPKDPDEARRKAAIAERKKQNKQKVEDPRTAFRPLTPDELNPGGKVVPAPSNSKTSDPVQPGEGGGDDREGCGHRGLRGWPAVAVTLLMAVLRWMEVAGGPSGRDLGHRRYARGPAGTAGR